MLLLDQPSASRMNRGSEYVEFQVMNKKFLALQSPYNLSSHLALNIRNWDSLHIGQFKEMSLGGVKKN